MNNLIFVRRTFAPLSLYVRWVSLAACATLIPMVDAAWAADVACTATVNGQGGVGQVVLPDSLMTDFPGLGSTAGWTKFSIALSGCPAGGVMVWTYFLSGYANATTGRLNNIPGVGQAAGVDLELTNGNAQAIQAHQGNTWGSGHSPVFAFGGGQAVFDYGVRYYRSGPIRPGSIRSNVNFVVEFQ